MDPLAEAAPVPGRGRGRARLWAALGASIAVLAGGLAVAAATRGGEGELLPRLSPTSSFGLSMDADDAVFSLSTPRIHEPGREVRLLSVDAGHSGNVEYLGALAVWPRDIVKTLVTGGPGFPTEHQPKHHPIDAPIPAAETAHQPPGWDEIPPISVVVGFRLLSGVGAVNGVTLTYTVDGKRKREHFRHAVVGCVKPNPCGTGDNDFSARTLRQLGLVQE